MPKYGSQQRALIKAAPAARTGTPRTLLVANQDNRAARPSICNRLGAKARSHPRTKCHSQSSARAAASRTIIVEMPSSVLDTSRSTPRPGGMKRAEQH